MYITQFGDRGLVADVEPPTMAPARVKA
jgi:hypothetical protein